MKCTECTTSGCFINRFCSAQEMNLVDLEKTAARYRSGQHIFREGETVFGIYFIRKGAVKVVSDTLYGRQQIVRLSANGNILGYRALGKSTYYFNAVTLTETDVCSIENDLYHQLCRSNNRLAYHLMLHYAHELGRTGLRMKYQAQMTVREKIAEAFVYFHDVFDSGEATRALNVPLTRNDIAGLAGTTIHQVSRQITEFRKEGWIVKRKREIVITDITMPADIVKRFKIC